MKNNYIYIFIMAITLYLIRVLPLTIIRKPIKNKYIKSFLYYIPYVTLAVMTFPSIIYSTESTISGIIALVIGLIVSYRGMDLFKVTVICCLSVFIVELFI
ncbi:MAG: AzlD domain-containing protein [Erysipelotrichaceae bacterium]|nr:AzlD domain-containing protein [Erysipelotrichaceae bacterium]